MSAPNAVTERGTTLGVDGLATLMIAIQMVATAGTRMITASTCPTRARRRTDHTAAKKISRLRAPSSKKSTLSATSDTDPMTRATANSTTK